MVTWTRPKNICEFLVKAKIPKAVINRHSVRVRLGFNHCKEIVIYVKILPDMLNLFYVLQQMEFFPFYQI